MAYVKVTSKELTSTLRDSACATIVSACSDALLRKPQLYHKGRMSELLSFDE